MFEVYVLGELSVASIGEWHMELTLCVLSLFIAHAGEKVYLFEVALFTSLFEVTRSGARIRLAGDSLTGRSEVRFQIQSNQ